MRVTDRSNPTDRVAERSCRVHLSDLFGCAVIDASTRCVGGLGDVVCRTREDDTLHVSGLMVTRQRHRQLFPTEQIEFRAASAGLSILVPSCLMQPISHAGHDTVFLRRDLLDSRIIDARGPRIARVNDVALTAVRGGWKVEGVTVAPRSFLRRMLPRRIRPVAASRLVPWTELVRLPTPNLPDPSPLLAARLAHVPPAAIVQLLATVYAQEAASILAALSESQAAAVLVAMPHHSRPTLLRVLGPLRATAIIGQMDETQRISVVNSLPQSIAGPIRVNLRRPASRVAVTSGREGEPRGAPGDGEGA